MKYGSQKMEEFDFLKDENIQKQLVDEFAQPGVKEDETVKEIKLSIKEHIYKRMLGPRKSKLHGLKSSTETPHDNLSNSRSTVHLRRSSNKEDHH